MAAAPSATAPFRTHSTLGSVDAAAHVTEEVQIFREDPRATLARDGVGCEKGVRVRAGVAKEDEEDEEEVDAMPVATSSAIAGRSGEILQQGNWSVDVTSAQYVGRARRRWPLGPGLLQDCWIVWDVDKALFRLFA